MREMKPLGSEKLSGDDKLKRILELTYFGEKKEKTTSNKAEYIVESKTGFYTIEKEKDGFYVKKGLTESTVDYIGGMFMKNKNRFNSYNEALKRLEYLKGQDLQEATKYVLKTNKPPMDTPPSPPVNDTPPVDNSIPPIPTGEESPNPDDELPPMGGEGAPEGELPPMGGEGAPEDEKANLRSGYMEEIQKFAGKLGQELRDQKEKLESDDIKYVINMVMSAIDIDQLDDEDLEDVMSKFERDEEEFEDPDMEDDGDVPPQPENQESPEKEISEFEGFDSNMSELEEFINSSLTDDDNYFSDFAMGNEKELSEFDVNFDDTNFDEEKFGEGNFDLESYSDNDTDFEFELPDEEQNGGEEFDLDSLGNDENIEELNEFGDIEVSSDNGVDWESKLRGNKNKVKKELNIDEISNAISDALRRFK